MATIPPFTTSAQPLLRIDAPPESWPDVSRAAALIQVVDRRSECGMRMLQHALGPFHMRTARELPGRWLVAVVGRAGKVLLDVHSEDELIQVHREVIELATTLRGHIEVFHFLEPSLRARICSDSRAHALRITPPAGFA